MAQGLMFTNHLHVLTVIARRPGVTLREIAQQVGITDRATHRIIGELVEHGYLSRVRVGARNRYQIHRETRLLAPLHAEHTIGQLIDLLTGTASRDLDDSPPAAAASERAEIVNETFAIAPAALVVADAGGRILAANRSFCALVGYEEDQLTGRRYRELTHPDDLPINDEALRELVSDDCPEYARESRYIRADGTLVWVLTRIRMSTAPTSGRPLFIVHAVEIGEHKHHHRALAEAEERFRSAFDNAPIGMALVTPDGRWLKVNRSLCAILGYPETDLLGRSFQSITHPDDLDSDLAYVQDMLAGRRHTYQMEKRYRHANGHLIWVTLSVSLVRDGAGQPLYFISHLEDITQRKQREQALQDRAARLTTLASTK